MSLYQDAGILTDWEALWARDPKHNCQLMTVRSQASRHSHNITRFWLKRGAVLSARKQPGRGILIAASLAMFAEFAPVHWQHAQDADEGASACQNCSYLHIICSASTTGHQRAPASLAVHAETSINEGHGRRRTWRILCPRSRQPSFSVLEMRMLQEVCTPRLSQL